MHNAVLTRICRTLIEVAGFRPLPPLPLSPPSEVSFPFPLPPLAFLAGIVEMNLMKKKKKRSRTLARVYCSTEYTLYDCGGTKSVGQAGDCFVPEAETEWKLY